LEASIPRLFTGLEVPRGLADEIAELRGGLSGARWIDVEDYHVTLRFVGDIDDDVAEDIFQELGRLRRAPVEIAFAGLAFFGGDKPRAIIMRVKPTQALMDLQADHERVARRAGLPAETRKFSPHVTIARLRGAKPVAVADYLGARGYVPARAYRADNFALFSSRDSTGGGPYVVEARYPLTSGADRP
jgi:2'-5' RNA ligase